MNFELECDEQDGLVFIDEAHLKELNSDLLSEMDILLDVLGQTELTFDFPDEKWETVWERETRTIREFCNSGKISFVVIGLFDVSISLYPIFKTGCGVSFLIIFEFKSPFITSFKNISSIFSSSIIT